MRDLWYEHMDAVVRAAMSKAALDPLGDALRMERRHQGIAVSYVEPGALSTRPRWRDRRPRRAVRPAAAAQVPGPPARPDGHVQPGRAKDVFASS